MTPLAAIVAADPSAPRVRQLQAALGAAVTAAPPPPAEASVVIWAQPWHRNRPLPGHGLQVLDLHGAIAASPGADGPAQTRWCARVARLCRGAALLLVGSPAEHGFWSALLADAGVDAPIAVVPYAPAAVPAAAPAMRVAGNLDHPRLQPVLDAAIGWAAAHGLVMEVAAPRATDRLLAAARGLPTAAAGAASVLLDLRCDTVAERVSTPPDVADALAAGAAVLTTVNGPLGTAIAAAGAGLVLTEGFAPPPDAAAARVAALALAAALFPPDSAAAALRVAIAQAEAAARRRQAPWVRGQHRPAQPMGPHGHVLVVSEESPNLAAVRVHLPFGALLARGVIGGYAVLHGNEIVFDSRAPAGDALIDPSLNGSGLADAAPFDAIWVHRSMEPEHRCLIDLLGRPFAYDIDDNLLATPSYRESFPGIARRTMQDLLQSAAVLSCATPRLAGLLIDRATVRLAERMVITPNLAQGRPAPRAPGPPTALIWASSDRPALTAARDDVVRAVRDHCLAHRVRLVCIGAAPPEALAGSGVEVESIGLLSHDDYRAHLRSLAPAILVCPLETGADAETQDFVDGKSDIKIIEALSDGLVGVFSRARPYQDSDIQGQILCENTYDGWLDGLDAARAACMAPVPPIAWPDARDCDGPGLAPWAEALARVRLDRPVGAAELAWAAAEVQARYARLITREEFDEAFYLGSHEDVRQAIEAGEIASGYDHFALAGHAERRRARKRRRIRSDSDVWWDDLLHEVNRIEAANVDRDARIDALERRLALRDALTPRP